MSSNAFYSAIPALAQIKEKFIFQSDRDAMFVEK